MSQAWLDYTDSMHSLYEDVYGVVRCADCGNDRWCQGIEQAIMEHADASTLWRGLDQRLDNIENVFVVMPLFVKHNLWITMRAEDVAIKDIVKLTYETLDLNKGKKFISFWLRRGEGRRIARSLFLQQFMAHIDLQAPVCCPQPSHSFVANQTLQSHMTGVSIDSLAEMFSIWSTYRCLTCANLVSASFLQQFVPEDPRKRNG